MDFIVLCYPSLFVDIGGGKYDRHNFKLRLYRLASDDTACSSEQNFTEETWTSYSLGEINGNE
jgi:hypothetical protein